MLSTDAVGKHFGGQRVLDGVAISIDAGEVVGLVGPNGSGKTTLLNCLSGFISPDEGSVRFEDQRIDHLPAWRIARLGLRRTFQLAAQPLKMSVLEAMLCGAYLPVGAASVRGLFARKARRAEERTALERARELLETLRLGHVADLPAGSLSGGQQKLLSIGVALMDRPRLLLLDEPTAGVNPALRQELVDHLRGINDAGTALLVIEHDMAFIGRLCQRVYVLDKGQLIASCRPDQLKDDPRVVEAYLGAPRVAPAGTGQ